MRLAEGAETTTFDPWSTDDGVDDGYSTDKFYTRATNEKDHSTKITIAIPKHLYGRLAEVVKLIPTYRSEADLLRDSLVHRLKYLKDFTNAEIEAALDLTMRTSRIEVRAERLRAMNDLLDAHRAVVAMAVDTENLVELAEAIKDVREDMDRFDEPYRGVLGEIAEGAKKRMKGIMKMGGDG